MGQTQLRTSAAVTSAFVQEVKEAVVSSTGRPQPSYRTVLASPDDSPPSTPVRPQQVYQQQHPQQVTNVHQVVAGQKPQIVLQTGEDVTHSVNSLAVGTQVIVKRADNASLPAVWNGKSITLKNTFPGRVLQVTNIIVLDICVVHIVNCKYFKLF